MPIPRRTLLAATPLFAMATVAPQAQAADLIRIGQATTALSFLPIWAARATDAFATQNLTLQWAAISGGDPATLAALDGNDIDLAAVGSDTALAAIAKGQPFTLIYDLMGTLSLDLIASNALLQRTNTTPQDPLPKRIAALKGAIVGVSALGGTQDRVTRWVAEQGGLHAADLRIALVGGPPALEAALENGRIDAFMLSPPEAGIVTAAGYGQRLVNPQQDFPALHGLPTLVLVARQSPDLDARITRAVAALSKAAAQTLATPDVMADTIGQKFFPKIAPPTLRDAIHALLPGLEGQGRFSPAQIALMRRFATESGNQAPQTDTFATNRYIDAATH